MARVKSPIRPPAGRSLLLTQVARAIAYESRRGTNVVPGHLSAALDDLARIAELFIPARGLVASEELRIAIDEVARRHLRRNHATREFRVAVERVEELPKREAIENAHARVVDLGELVHYYAGVTAALTLTELIRK